MGFKLGKKSIRTMEGLHPDLIKVINLAICYTEQDFSVHDGVRSISTQKAMVKSGASTTMNSRHLTGHAADLVPWIAGQLRWEWPACFKIAVAMDRASTELNIPLRWGGVWDRLMTEYGGSPESLKNAVDEYCVRHPGKDFLDGPHFELPREVYP